MKKGVTGPQKPPGIIIPWAALAGAQLALLPWQVLCKEQQGVPAAEQGAKSREARQLRAWIIQAGNPPDSQRDLRVPFVGFQVLTHFWAAQE